MFERFDAVACEVLEALDAALVAGIVMLCLEAYLFSVSPELVWSLINCCA